MDPASRLCTGVIDDLVEMQANLLLGSPLIELALETPLTLETHFGLSFHSEKSIFSLDSLSAIMFSLLGRYSVETVIPRDRR